MIWWLTASDRESIDAGLANLAVAIQPQLQALSLETLREWAVQWLASHAGWLVVLDNAEEPGDIKPLLNRVTTGRFIIIHRHSMDWQGSKLHVYPLNPNDAERLLLDIIAESRDFGGASRRLVEELGYLPLAIEQAGAYIRQTYISTSEYLELLTTYPERMLQATAEGADPQRSTARVVAVTLDRLADTPLALQLLGIMSFYDSHDIPLMLFDSLASHADLTSAIERLAAYDLTTVDDDMLTVHPLVQTIVRNERRQWGIDIERVSTGRESACRNYSELMA